MDWTALGTSVDFTGPLGFMGVAAGALVVAYVALKGIQLGFAALKK